jgi:homospermidine synthase
MDQFIWVGYGAVAYGLTEIMNREKSYQNTKFIVIEPRDIKTNGRYEALIHRKPVWLKEYVTRENCDEIFDPIMTSKTTLINLSVDVDSIMLLKKAKQYKALYIDTSLENYDDSERPHKVGTDYKEIRDNTLYYRQLLADKVMKNVERTSVLSFGFNPGIIGLYMLKSLVEYAKLKRPEVLKGFKGDYAKLAHDLKCEELLVAEYDSQKTKLKPNINLFINSWSAVGYQLEAVDNCMLNLSNADIDHYTKAGVKLIKPTEEEDTHIRFLAERGMDVFRPCIGLDYDGEPFKYESRLIPHMEIASVGRYLTYNGDCPSIMYCYRSSDVSQQSLGFLEKNNYELLKDDYVMWAKDIEPKGYDSIGALCKFRCENGKQDVFWGGSVISIEDSRAMGFKSGCTVIQVAGSMNAALKWVLKNQEEGLTNPEEIPYDFIFKAAKPYMGREYFKLLDVE